MTRLIIAGSRNFNNKELLYKSVKDVVSSVGDDVEIVSGHCRGADMLGEQFAKDMNIPVIVFPADWNRYGKRAGYIRNTDMAKYASQCNGILIAFPVGESKGTRMMVRIANQYKLKVYVVEEN